MKGSLQTKNRLCSWLTEKWVICIPLHQETSFQEIDTHNWLKKTAWLKLFVRQASKRGYDKIYGISGFDLNLPGKDMLKTIGNPEERKRHVGRYVLRAGRASSPGS